ncbi:putative MFS family arabinose efflux permease [Asanoa ferruginea]|uniref:Putative MFS family arabinose efflux permease n=1 Tax=Asanoa ferruginea TaxID=53367 RepID=A0A3D9ZNF4_9ACTN|nr:MFS transporter [Asanoa ferruginea]REF98896.1 putative MFS family arabinose efflux permease [Asanoa ferruginea]GIF46422.1 MFS transporter [Asanoa ferruginea]
MTEQPDPSFARNIRLIYRWQALTNVSLWMPIWIVFLEHDRHLTLTEIYVIAGAGWIVQAVSDVPLGVFADTFGRRVTLISGTVLLAIGLGSLAVLPGFWGVATGYLFWAIGTAMASGTETALLYDSAVKAGREAEWPRIASHSFQVIQGAQAVGSIAGGLLAAINLALPMAATAVLTGIALFFVGATREVPIEHEERRGYAATLAFAGRYLAAHPPVLSIVGYAALISGTAFFVPFVLFQPTAQSFAVSVGWLGVLFFGLRLSALLGSRYGYLIISERRLGFWLTSTPIAISALFVGVASSRSWWTAYLAMLLIAAVSAGVRPHTSDVLNRMVVAKIRATILSFQNLVMTVFIAVMHPAVGGITDLSGLRWAFVLLAGLSLLPLLARPFIPLHTSQKPADTQEDEMTPEARQHSSVES